MHKRTHLRIAIITKRAVERELNMKLSTSGFLYGNIKPDISYKMIKNPHCKHKSSGVVRKEIEQLFNLDIKSHAGCKGEFSRKLGVITHYISDFFCHSHNKDFKGSMVDHFLYELNLDQYFRNKASVGNILLYAKKLDSIEGTGCIVSYLDKLHSEYCKKGPSYTNDMTYSLNACITTAISIIFSCIQQKSMGTAA